MGAPWKTLSGFRSRRPFGGVRRRRTTKPRFRLSDEHPAAGDVSAELTDKAHVDDIADEAWASRLTLQIHQRADQAIGVHHPRWLQQESKAVEAERDVATQQARLVVAETRSDQAQLAAGTPRRPGTALALLGHVVLIALGVVEGLLALVAFRLLIGTSVLDPSDPVLVWLAPKLPLLAALVVAAVCVFGTKFAGKWFAEARDAPALARIEAVARATPQDGASEPSPEEVRAGARRKRFLAAAVVLGVLATWAPIQYMRDDGAQALETRAASSAQVGVIGAAGSLLEVVPNAAEANPLTSKSHGWVYFSVSGALVLLGVAIAYGIARPTDDRLRDIRHAEEEQRKTTEQFQRRANKHRAAATHELNRILVVWEGAKRLEREAVTEAVERQLIRRSQNPTKFGVWSSEYPVKASSGQLVSWPAVAAPATIFDRLHSTHHQHAEANSDRPRSERTEGDSRSGRKTSTAYGAPRLIHLPSPTHERGTPDPEVNGGRPSEAANGRNAQ